MMCCKNVLVRLDRCLVQDVVPSPTAYFRLAATNMRRELIDLARHYYGPLGLGANYSTPNAKNLHDLDGEHFASERDDPARLIVAREIHEVVERLPSEIREVAEFCWYLGMTKPEVANTLGLSLSTVKRRCIEAKLMVEERLGTRPDYEILENH